MTDSQHLITGGYFADFKRAHNAGARTAQSLLGNISPGNIIRAGRYKRLINFVLDTREAARATPKTQSETG